MDVDNKLEPEAEGADAQAELDAEIEAPAEGTAEHEFQVRGFAEPEDEAEAEAEEPEVAAEAAEDEEKPKAEKIRIGDKTFEDPREAWTYAEELERERLASDAFRQGVEAARGGEKSNTPATPAEDKFDEEFYADPKAYLARARAEVKEEVKREISGAHEQAAKNKATWDKFYNDNPDLVAAKRLVQSVLAEDWDTLKDINAEKALKIVADKVRAEKKAMITDALPKTELTGKKPVGSQAAQKKVTPEKTEERALNFAQQLRNLKKGRTTNPAQ